ncbi:MAG: hypothetical protein SFV51_01410 [Bryobacteraceae bacterium]|nr:hypothetical protein [Bryobacteraceae bacterium]
MFRTFHKVMAVAALFVMTLAAAMPVAAMNCCPGDCCDKGSCCRNNR